MEDNPFKAKIANLLLTKHSAETRDVVVNLIGGDTDRFQAAWEIFCSDEPPLPQRMSWVLEHLTAKHPSHAARYVSSIIARIPFMKHPAELRAATKILSKTPLQRSFIPELYDPMLQLFMDPQIPIAIRANSLVVLYEITQMEPEFKYELELVIADQMPNAGPAIISRGKKILKNLKQEIQKMEMEANS